MEQAWSRYRVTEGIEAYPIRMNRESPKKRKLRMSLPCERKGSTKRTMRAQVSRLRRAPQDSNAWRVPLKTMLRKSVGINAKPCGGALPSIHHQLYMDDELAGLSLNNFCAGAVCS